MNFGNVIIFGDSYSTFEGYVPEGYEVHYSPTKGTGGVLSVDKTWWYQLMKETGSNLVLNDSWSGSTICYTWYHGDDCSETSSFITRLGKMIDGGFFEENKIDTVFVFGGTNDSWAKSPLGEEKTENWEKQDLYSVLPAIYCFLDKIRATLPEARIVWLINTELRDEITACMKNACAKYGAHCLQLRDIDKDEAHPSVLGMKQIKDQIIEFFG